MASRFATRSKPIEKPIDISRFATPSKSVEKPKDISRFATPPTGFVTPSKPVEKPTDISRFATPSKQPETLHSIKCKYCNKIINKFETHHDQYHADCYTHLKYVNLF